jgi:hypothetical protein
MAGWPALMWWTLRDTGGQTALGTWVVVLLAEGLLVLLAASTRRHPASRPSVEKEGVYA